MAKTSSTPSKDIHEVVSNRSQTWLHQAMIDWLEETLDVDMSKMTPVEILSVAFARHIEWRKTDRYREVKDQHKAEAEAAIAERKAARLAAKEAAKSEGDAEAPAKKASSKKAPATKKSAPKGRRVSKKTRKSEEDNPFE